MKKTGVEDVLKRVWGRLPTQWLRSFYIERVLGSRTFARAFPFRHPPALLLSYPRSGSSWIGKVLSTSPEIAYLREPINQACITEFEGSTVVDPARDERTLEAYCRFGDLAFSGRPPVHVHNVVDSIWDFTPFRRSKRVLLIKEVNPLAAGLFVGRYSPKMILVARHPAAVADSYLRMGWLAADGLEQFGYRYGKNMEAALEACVEARGTTVRFEDIALHPREQFSRLFDYLGARLPSDFESIVAEYSESKVSNADPWSVRRNSRDETVKWRPHLGSKQVDAVMKGYLRSELPFYREEEDWAYA